jgi:hypothetical protein
MKSWHAGLLTALLAAVSAWAWLAMLRPDNVLPLAALLALC